MGGEHPVTGGIQSLRVRKAPGGGGVGVGFHSDTVQMPGVTFQGSCWPFGNKFMYSAKNKLCVLRGNRRHVSILRFPPRTELPNCPVCELVPGPQRDEGSRKPSLCTPPPPPGAASGYQHQSWVCVWGGLCMTEGHFLPRHPLLRGRRRNTHLAVLSSLFQAGPCERASEHQAGQQCSCCWPFWGSCWGRPGLQL